MATRTGEVDPSASGEGKDAERQDKRPTSESEPSAEITSLRDRLMRALAETENTRRQGERRAQDAHRYAISNFARELLQVVDNLRRALEAAKTETEARDTETRNEERLMEGVAATERVLMQILNRFGIEEINALNAPFDPQKHEAVMETDQTEQAPGNVVQVLEDGYMLHDRLLRPARVVVARPAQQPPQAAEQ